MSLRLLLLFCHVKVSSCLVQLGSPGLTMARVLPPAGVFFCIGASGLVCTGRLLQNMLGLECEFKGRVLFCTRFLTATLFFCRKMGWYFYHVARQTWLASCINLRNIHGHSAPCWPWVADAMADGSDPGQGKTRSSREQAGVYSEKRGDQFRAEP